MKLELRRVTALSPRAQDARRHWPARESLLLRLTDQEGRAGIGEASPLPGYSRDALPEVEQALARLPASSLSVAFGEEAPRSVLQAIASLVPPSLPSARMALETAALDLLGVQQNLAAPLLLGAKPGASRSLAKLLGPAVSPTLQRDAELAVQDGFKQLKLKVGAAGQLAAEIEAIAALRERLGPGVALRLDANGTLTASETEAAWAQLRTVGIELFEEPGPLPESLLGTVPLALDESLQGLSPQEVEALLRQSCARAVVLKPMALGGLEHCFRLAELAQKLGVGAVISHSFDGPFAFRAAAALALALPEGLAHGLAPHAGLDGWALGELQVVRGALELWQEPGLGAPAAHGFP